MDVKIQLPKNVLTIMDIIKEYGAESYVVGGCVRDSLLRRSPQDWDICSPVPVAELRLFFQEKGFRTIDTGVKHGTISIIVGNEIYEITTFRKDGNYSDGRRPDQVEFISDLKEDLARRDFTINAMAYNDIEGIIDPFGGQEDLTNGIIRCVGDAKERFTEDALRIMRALRFSSLYGLTIEEETQVAMKHCSPLLKNIAMERINKELNAILLSDHAKDILLLYKDMFVALIPSIKPYEFGVYQYLCHWMVAAPKDLSIRLAILFSRTYGTEEYLQNLRYDNITINDVCFILDNFNTTYFMPVKSYLKKFLKDYGVSITYKLLYMKSSCPTTTDSQQARYTTCLRLLDEIKRNNECYSLQQLQINGRDLIKLGMKPGKEIGEVLNLLLEEVISNRIENDPVMLVARAGVLIKKGGYV